MSERQAETNTLDILSPKPGPALNTTSDMPVVAQEDYPQGTTAEFPETTTTETTTDTPTVTETAAAEPSPRKRITEAEARRAAEQRADTLMRGLEQALETIRSLTEKPVEKPVETKPTETTPAADARPRRQDFDDPDAYEDAVFDWRERKTMAELDKRFNADKEARENETRQRQEQAQQNDLVARWQRNREQAIKENPDFVEVAENKDLFINQPMLHAMMIADDSGPKIALWLGRNIEEANRIIAASNQNPITAFYEIGRIRQIIEAPKTPEPKPTSTPEPVTEELETRSGPALPNPITPLEGVNGSTADLTIDKMSMEEYARSRMPQLMAERRASMWGNRTN